MYEKSYFIICLVVLIFTGCLVPTGGNDNHHGKNALGAKKIEDVLKEHTEELMSLLGVVGTGQGLCNGRPCIKVFVTKKSPELDQKIPDLLEGYEVSIEITGEIRAHPDN
jgi:hypothetical protein